MTLFCNPLEFPSAHNINPNLHDAESIYRSVSPKNPAIESESPSSQESQSFLTRPQEKHSSPYIPTGSEFSAFDLTSNDSSVSSSSLREVEYTRGSQKSVEGMFKSMIHGTNRSRVLNQGREKRVVSTNGEKDKTT